MSGGKGGSQTTAVEVPPHVSDAARRNLKRADKIAGIGYTPYFGADVAAMTPMQQAAMQGTNQMSSAFGLPSVSDPMAGMPQAQDFGGMQAYSSAPLFEQSLQSLAQNRPEQYKAIEGMFNPTGGTNYASGYGSGGGYGSGYGYGTGTGGGVSYSGGGLLQEIEANDPTPQGMTRMEYNLMKNPNKYVTKSLTDDELEQQYYYNTGLL